MYKHDYEERCGIFWIDGGITVYTSKIDQGGFGHDRLTGGSKIARPEVISMIVMVALIGLLNLHTVISEIPHEHVWIMQIMFTAVMAILIPFIYDEITRWRKREAIRSIWDMEEKETETIIRNYRRLSPNKREAKIKMLVTRLEKIEAVIPNAFGEVWYSVYASRVLHFKDVLENEAKADLDRLYLSEDIMIFLKFLSRHD